jgi:hypothetical protein
MQNEAEIMALAVGDAVLIRVGHTHWTEHEVTRVTAAQVMVGETRYHRKDGQSYRAGDEVGRASWSYSRIRALTPALRAERGGEDARNALERRARAALVTLEAHVKGARTDAELEAFCAYVEAL